ncbi:type I secretion system permease/ATPase [Primorskyibacter sp. S87]|uniref:type I secretion system permease/ATPase n=1 Tax=Primorskyibacter sp. S87 TaxID=3415126 RepID=UPI003C7EA360
MSVIAWFAARYGRPFTETAVVSRIPAGTNTRHADGLIRGFETIGLRARLYKSTLRRLDPAVLPCVAFDRTNRPVIVESFDSSRHTVKITSAHTGKTTREPVRDLQRRIAPQVLLVTPEQGDARALKSPPGAAQSNGHWFWGPVLGNWRSWGQIMLASLLINILALALPLFIMNVYDRVIPSLSFVTLWTLAGGVGIAIGMDLLLRALRAQIIERIGRRVDLQVATSLFRQAMDLRMAERQSGAAGLASRIREYEAVREFFTSSSFASFVDLLFIGVFIAVLFAIVGPLAYVPLAGVAAILLVALVAQIPMARSASQAGNVATHRHVVLMEALSGVETLKTLNAEPVMQREWEGAVAASARVNGRTRLWSNFTSSCTIMVQQLVSVVIIVLGVYMIAENQITIGGLIAANILSSRALAPLGTIAQTVFRAQYARKSMLALNEMMGLETEREASIKSNLRVKTGSLSIRDVGYTFPEAQLPALDHLSLEIAAGETVALLGRVGSGKSTLGKLVSGLIQPDSGLVLVDDYGSNQYDPAELRTGIGYLPQRSEFFTGTLRENLVLGRPNATQEEIDEALFIAGLSDYVAESPEGLDLHIGEDGNNLSGGQAQALALARILLGQHKLLFLDEPTNAMDQVMEQRVCERLGLLKARGTGLILCTHRASLADLADRFVVLEKGRLLIDGSKNEVMQQLVSADADSGGAG